MVFLVNVDCPCCQDYLWHDWACWRDYHNGTLDDYIEPEYYGMPMNEKVEKKLSKRFNLNKTIKPNKRLGYKEGVYH